MKIEIIEIPADNFFPVRFSVRREDGATTHPAIDREHCEWLVSKAKELGGKESYIAAKRDKPGKPWVRIGGVAGTCLSDAEQKAFILGFTPMDHLQDYHRTFRVFHHADWQTIQLSQHLKAVGIKRKR